MRSRHCLWMVALVAGAVQGAVPQATTPRAIGLSDAEKEAFLLQGEVVRTRSAGAGITGSLRATLRRDGREHDAHIQTIDQTRAPGGLTGAIAIDFRDTFHGNLAAYRLDRLLGLGMIPVTVERTWDRKKAAFTWWVDDVAMSDLERQKRKLQPPDVTAWNRQMWVVRLFDQLIYNFDRNMGNLLIDSGWRLWMIDHTRAFKFFKELEEPKNLAPRCERRLLAALRRLDAPTLHRALADQLSDGQIEAILARRDRIVSYYDARIAQLGEEAVLYDLPARADPPAVN